MTSLRRPLLSAVAASIALATPALALSPAQAGGPGTVRVYGATYNECTNSLSYTVKLYRANGYTVTGVHGCRKTGDGSRYFGDFVAN